MNGEKLNSSRAPQAVGLYPHARKFGDMLFLSGVGPRTLDSKDIPGVTLNNEGKIVDYDIEKQCHSVFNNIKVILEDCGIAFLLINSDQLIEDHNNKAANFFHKESLKGKSLDEIFEI